MLAASSGQYLVIDGFNGYKSGTTITDDTTYTFPGFPSDGDSTAANKSDTWTTGSGAFLAVSGHGHQGFWHTADPNDSNFGRVHTRSHIQSAGQRFKFTCSFDAFESRGGGSPGDAFDAWVGYKTQYKLYAVQLFRRGGGSETKGDVAILKHKVPCDSYTGPGGNVNNIANSGVYYTVKTEASGNPSGNNSNFNPTYSNAGLSAMADDGTTYDFEITKQDIGVNQVRITLKRGGVLVATWVDDGAHDQSPGGTSANTLNADRAAGYFTGTSGYNVNNYYPETGSGRVGWRSQNLPWDVWNETYEVI